MHWEEMRYWRSQGVMNYDMGGGGEYKAKFGGTEVPTYWFHQSRYHVMSLGRSAVRRAVWTRQRVAGRLARPDEQVGSTTKDAS